jgi:hypothetical protein
MLAVLTGGRVGQPNKLYAVHKVPGTIAGSRGDNDRSNGKEKGAPWVSSAVIAAQCSGTKELEAGKKRWEAQPGEEWKWTGHDSGCLSADRA